MNYEKDNGTKLELTTSKKKTMKGRIESILDECDSKDEVVEKIEKGYIFGEYANNQHYSRDVIRSVVEEVWESKKPAEKEETE